MLDDSSLNPAIKTRVFLLAIVILLAALNLSHLWIQTSNPEETSNPESLFILHAVELSDGKPLYTDFRKTPYNVTQYTPLHYTILATLHRTLLKDIDSLFVWGRRLTLALTIIIAFLIFRHGRRQGGGNSISLIAPLLFLGSYALWPFASTNRPDVLGALLSIAAVFVFVNHKNFGLILAVTLTILAFYTKQSFFSAPASILLFLLLNRQTKRAIQFSAATIMLTGLIWFLLHFATDGMSTLNLLAANMAPMKLQNVRLVTGLILQTAAIPIVLSFSGLTKEWKKDCISIYFLISFSWAILTSAKLGSNTNYFIEPLAAGCMLIPGTLQRSLTSTSIVRSLVIAIFLVLALPQINFLTHTLTALQFKNTDSARRIAAEATGLVISDSPRISFASRSPFLMDPYVYSYLESTGQWNSSDLISLIKNGNVQYLILISPLEHPLSWQGVTRLPAGVITACSSEFKQTGIVDGYSIYVHR